MILVRFEGAASVAGFLSSSAAVCADERYRHGYDGFIDLTSMHVTIDPHEIGEFVAFSLSKRKHGHGKWAVLVNSPIATAFAMLYHQGVSEKHPFSLFNGLEGAAAFLERPIDLEFLENSLPR